ncbi:DUF1501 domain-containing protein [Sphingomonas sp. MMS24-JH45]
MDFGRTLTSNDDGSDHGWGSMHFVMGGAVRGQRIYGTPPAIGSDTDSDVGQGRLIPTTSVDQYAATLASWFGVGRSDLSLVLPNIGNYNKSGWNLGFVRSRLRTTVLQVFGDRRHPGEVRGIDRRGVAERHQPGLDQRVGDRAQLARCEEVAHRVAHRLDRPDHRDHCGNAQVQVGGRRRRCDDQFDARAGTRRRQEPLSGASSATGSTGSAGSPCPAFPLP